MSYKIVTNISLQERINFHAYGLVDPHFAIDFCLGMWYNKNEEEYNIRGVTIG